MNKVNEKILVLLADFLTINLAWVLFFAIRVKQSWESSDLVDAGNNMLNYIKQNKSSFIRILGGDFTEIEKIRLGNIGYGMTVKDSPKSNIIVGCTPYEQCLYLENLLTDAYLNGRKISFEVIEFNIDEGIPHFLDAVVLVNYTGYTIPEIKNSITNYLNNGGVVIGINGTYGNNQDFKDIFGLNDIGDLSGDNYFVSYP